MDERRTEPGDAEPTPRPDPVLLRRGNLVVTRRRAVEVGAVVLLLVLGAALPYVTLTYVNNTSVQVTGTRWLFHAASLLGGVDPTYLPGYRQEIRDTYDLALNFAAAGPGLQQVGTVVALLTCWALLTEEIHKFAWWPLHLSGYPLVLGPVMILIGDHQLHTLAVPVHLGPAWVASLLAGILVLATTLRARSRIDTYGGV